MVTLYITNARTDVVIATITGKTKVLCEQQAPILGYPQTGSKHGTLGYLICTPEKTARLGLNDHDYFIKYTLAA